MEQQKLHILSVYLKKWSYGENKVTVNYSLSVGNNYYRKHRDQKLAKATNMVNELLAQILKDAKSLEGKNEKAQIQIKLINEGEAKKKLNAFFLKITKEFNQNKKSRGKSRMISSRSVDFYYSDSEYELLEDEIKFFVHLNRGLNKVNGDLWSNAISDFKMALKFKPDNVQVNKHLAIAYNKLGQFSDALSPLKIYADSEQSADSLNTLATVYINLEEFDKADEIYQQIAEEFEDTITALFGRAQIAYKQGHDYTKYLDEINKSNPTKLIEKLKNNWEYRLSNEDLQTQWNASTAARYLGFDRPFDLTKKAFNKEIPCYFNADKGTIRFIKEEIDCWIELRNRYNLDGSKYKVFENKLTPEEKGTKRKKKQSAKVAS
jgi:tetratricopeptide (TPR) repeat protein